MMDNCHNLDTLAINTTMGNLSENACNKVGTDDKPCVILAPWGFDFGVDTNQGTFNWKSGFFQLAPESPYVLVSEDETIMTFYFDNLVTARRGKTLNIGKYEGLDENDAAKVTKVVFDPSFANARPKSTYRWFYRMSNLMTIEGMKNLNTSEVNNMRAMFNDCSSLQIIDLSHFDTSSATTMHNLFNGCTNLISLDVKGFDTSKVTDMYAMFNNCKSLTSLDVSGFNTTKVKTMYAMFNNCSGLASLDVSKFNTSSVTTTRAMFKECTSLKNLDISNFDMSKVTNSELMFDNCRNLETFHISSTMDNLNEEACRGVGTQENPCVLICPKDFNFGNVIPERTFKWKSGYFTIPDGIAPTTIDNADSTDQPIYNLQGIRVLSSKRGIYIRNGKKVMVK